MNSIDYTILTNATIPGYWICPYCGKRNKTRLFANDVLLLHFKYLEDCEACGYVHCWKLKVTDEFKRYVTEILRSMADQDGKLSIM